ncbi:MAG: hypothetical protein LKJ90_07730 [Faecalibacterium sp.]|jgi:hypothetical protein|nr:hypothetical protein [Faecalibacterium sp.]
MKKQIKKIAAVLAGMSIACTCLPMAAFAADAPQYNIVFSAGECGTIPNNMVPSKAGSVVSPVVTVKDSDLYSAYEFYCADTNESVQIDQNSMTATVPVTGDAIYVAQYIAANSALSCTIQYVDESGIEIAPSKSYRVQSGDSVAEAAAAVAGYTYASADYTVNGGAAQAYAGSVKVTSATAIVFHYTANANVITNTTTTTNTVYTDNVTTVGAAAVAGGAGAAAGVGGTTITDNETPLAGGNGNAAGAGESAASSQPSETIEDSEVPQAASVHSVSVAMVAGILAAVAVAMVAVVVFIRKKKSAHQG